MKRALRVFLSTPGFFTVVVLTLAVGIGANTAIFSVVRGVLLRPLPYHEPHELVAIGQSALGLTGYGPLSVLEYLDTKEQVEGAEGMAAYAGGDVNLGGEGTAAQRVNAAWTTPALFQLLGVTPSLGRWFAPGEDVPGQDHVAVISHSLWQNRFGADPAIAGKDVRLDNETFKIVGVLPASFIFEENADVYVPMGFSAEQRAEGTRDQHWLRVVARRKPGVTLGQLESELTIAGARQRAAHPNVYSESSGWRPAARPLLENLVADVRPSLLLLAAAAGLVLLIVCGNVASLLLARASTRQRELSVRAALGATRWRLVAQLLGESLLLSAIGGALGLIIAAWGTDVLLSLAPEGLPRAGQIHLDGTVLTFSVLLTGVTGAVFGMIPALSASRVDMQDALRATSRTSSAGKHPRRVRHALVIAETALALVLVTAAALVTRSFGKVVNVDPGFRTDGVLSLKVALPTPTGQATQADFNRYRAWYAEAESRLAALPGVTSASTINRLPLADSLTDRLLDFEGEPTPKGGERPDAQYRLVGAGYFETMGIPLRRGRTIGGGDVLAGMPVAVVSESFAQRLMPGREALGRRVRTSSPQGPWVTIVGVVGDVHDGGLDAPVQPTLYVPVAQVEGSSTRAIVVRGATAMGPLAASVRAELERFDPQQPIYDLRPMTARIAQNVEQRRFVLVLFELFAGLALALAMLGLYGVLAHAVTDRRREIGVRVALGATRGKVLGLVAREGAILLGVGVALGLAGGLAGTRVLAHLLYDVSPTDPLAIAAAIGLIAVAATLAMWLPVRRALRVDPMEALRDE